MSVCTEPVRLCLFGPPGAGKSHCMHLLRDFFETCLKWTDGVQFQYLVPLNTMADLIGGKTVHAWGCIPANKAAGLSKARNNKDADWDQLFENALSMRWFSPFHLVTNKISSLYRTENTELPARYTRTEITGCLSYINRMRNDAHGVSVG